MNHDIAISELNNGIIVASKPIAESRGTAVGIWLLNGSRHQTRSECGYAHFLEHVLFKGTAELDTRTLASRFETMGGQVNAHTGKELTAFHGLVPNQDAPELVKLFASMLCRPRFNEQDVNIERDVVFQEIAMVKDNPEEMLEEDMTKALWPGHPMAWPILGDPDTLESLTAATLHQYLRNMLCGARIWIVAAGGIDHAELERACAELSELPRGSRPEVTAPNFSAAQVKNRYGIAQACLSWAMPGPVVSSPSYHAFVVANHILGGGTTSRLFQEIREDRGLVYGIHSQLETYSDAGIWGIQTACEPEHHEECREAVERSTESLLASGPTAEELGTTLRFARANLLLEQQNLETSMERLAREMIYLGKPMSLDEHLSLLEAVTREHVRDCLADAWATRAFGQTMP